MSEAQGTEKAAAEEAQGRLRAFTVGIGELCKETGLGYDQLAKEAGVKPEALAPALVNSMASAAAQSAQQDGGKA